MKKKILITRKLLKKNEEKALKLWDVKLNENDEIYSQEQIVQLSKDCDGILSSIVDKIDEKVINQLSDKVKIISNFAVGFGNIDIKVAKKRNIVVTNTPDVLTDATAEITMLLILGAARRATEGIKFARKKKSDCMVVVQANSHPHDSDTVEYDKNNTINKIIFKNSKNKKINPS